MRYCLTLKRHDKNHDGALSTGELAAYIGGTLQRSISALPEVVREFDVDADGRLNLEEFCELDFHFPWEK